MSGFSSVVVDRIWVRDQGCCARCGKALRPGGRGFDWSAHHRCPRSSGGTRRLWVDGAANGLLLCGSATSPEGCHNAVESHRAQAFAEGFLVSANGLLRADEVAVRHVIHGLVLLTDAGWLLPVEQGPTPESIEGWVKG